jgi:hypothetical protein
MNDPRIEVMDMIWDIRNRLNDLEAIIANIPHEVEEYDYPLHPPVEGDYMHPDTPTHPCPPDFGEDAYWDSGYQCWMMPSEWDWDQHDNYANMDTDMNWMPEDEEWMQDPEHDDWSNEYDSDCMIYPPMPEEELQEDDSQIHAKNIYVVLINEYNQLLVEGELMDISQLKDGAKKFINNNGVDPNSSENPEKAIISLQNDRGTEYMTYIRVQNELAAAYTDLRNNASLNEFGESYADLNKTQMKEIRKMYPQKISEAEPKNIGGDE